MRVRRTSVLAFPVVIVVALLVGCGSGRLETGYEYVPLGSTETSRRAMYAGPFSPEARAAQIEEFQGQQNRAGQ